ncbi:hypothetical protein FQP90_15680 [Paenarthrobacter nitroguajacolicus]|uniref:Uncharacterized protein n=1 Tax=Paenarthrobacter nitroguajacolicus TaxID=211146 RepID=A0A558GVS9_PAENT|nr:hypothetical protein [Paenarthrobacter nitroguajacolicus]TVU60983.1 hypothetical protein FQP90_15680 [Paenarthrobacter nitroguajacolicus]
MTSLASFATPALLSLTEAPDIHLLLMAGLVLFAGLVAAGTIFLLLLLGPILTVALGCRAPGSRRRRRD